VLSARLQRTFIHYGWFIAGTGTLCILASLGIGRFSLGMLLPAMGKSLALSPAEMGYLGTGNFAGYLLSALVCGHLSSRFGSRRVIFAALLLVGTTMVLVGLSTNFGLLLILYAATGMGSGASNIPMMSLVATWFDRRHRGRAAGFIVIGSGFAIMMTGRMIPWINNLYPDEGWRLNWQILGGLVILIALLCWHVLRDRPQDIGRLPVGVHPDDPSEARAEASPASPTDRPHLRGTVIHLGAIYFLFGYTYVIYVTFMVSSLVKDMGYGEQAAGTLWSWVGILSLLSGPVMGTVSDRIGRKAALSIVFSIQAVSYLLIGLQLPGLFLYLSVVLFGVVAWSIPSIMAALVGDYVGPEKTAKIFGLVTFIFGFGQILGPAVAGLLAEQSGSFSASFIMASLLAGAAVLLSASLRAPARS